jgi:hypothetical protein
VKWRPRPLSRMNMPVFTGPARRSSAAGFDSAY